MSIGIGGSIGLDGLLTRIISQRREEIGRTLERLSTGQRINRASDDPAGTAALAELRAERAEIESRLQGLERANVRLAAEDGARSVMGDLLVELESLVVQAGNTGALSDAEREALQVEAGGLLDGLTRVIGTTVFNGQQLFAGETLGRLGTEGGGSIADLVAGGDLNLVDGDLVTAQSVVEAAREQISDRRGTIGSLMKRNESEARALLSEFENVSGAISLIGDADFAREVASLTRERVLERASVGAVLLARQQQSEAVLGLLSGTGTETRS